MIRLVINIIKTFYIGIPNRLLYWGLGVTVVFLIIELYWYL